MAGVVCLWLRPSLHEVNTLVPLVSILSLSLSLSHTHTHTHTLSHTHTHTHSLSLPISSIHSLTHFFLSHLSRCGYSPSSTTSLRTTLAQDQALVHHVDSLCRHFTVSSSSLQPWDLFLSEASLTSQQLAPLQGMSLADLRRRFLQLKYINQQLSLLLPVIDLRSSSSNPLCLGGRLSQLAPLLFYDVKMSFLHAVLNASTRRSLDQAPPEIKMDPLESLTGGSECVRVCMQGTKLGVILRWPHWPLTDSCRLPIQI